MKATRQVAGQRVFKKLVLRVSLASPSILYTYLQTINKHFLSSYIVRKQRGARKQSYFTEHVQPSFTQHDATTGFLLKVLFRSSLAIYFCVVFFFFLEGTSVHSRGFAGKSLTRWPGL